MNFISILSLLVLGIAIIATAVLLFIAITKNFQLGQNFRAQYVEKVESMRFGEMLKKHGVNLQHLLHNHSISNIEMQIRNCRACVITPQCDHVLNNSIVSEQELSFCPNHSSIIGK